MKESILEPDPRSTARPARTSQPAKTHRFRFLKVGAVVVVISAAGLAILGIASRSAATKVLQAQSDATSLPIVTVVSPEKAPAKVTLQLPGETRAFTQAPIFAQTSVYVK
ncbi:MAG: hypothetical protein WB696_24725, partial [Chthoniobacterales bacterium]